MGREVEGVVKVMGKAWLEVDVVGSEAGFAGAGLPINQAAA
jgi:hypothetical protein